MSRPNPRYTNSIWEKLALWARGEYDPTAGKLETRSPDKAIFSDEGLHYVHLHIRNVREKEQDRVNRSLQGQIRGFRRLYIVLALLLAVFLTGVLLYTVSYLPQYGDPNAPENNIVAARYITDGLAETGAVNIVAGMILDYRAFDTFGESCVLFVAACCVLILLRVDKDEEPGSAALEAVNDRNFEPKNDTILQGSARILVPLTLIFGVYVVLNGHLSPGGGFSGGAIIGAGLILYLTAFGFKKTERFINERVVRVLTVSALSFYAIAKSYSFYCGANHLESGISPGVPGALLSAGLIPYLNICVGIVVACTMYSFYCMFRKGGF